MEIKVKVSYFIIAVRKKINGLQIENYKTDTQRKIILLEKGKGKKKKKKSSCSKYVDTNLKKNQLSDL